jgi:hypothetical protein
MVPSGPVYFSNHILDKTFRQYLYGIISKRFPILLLRFAVSRAYQRGSGLLDVADKAPRLETHTHTAYRSVRIATTQRRRRALLPPMSPPTRTVQADLDHKVIELQPPERYPEETDRDAVVKKEVICPLQQKVLVRLRRLGTQASA